MLVILIITILTLTRIQQSIDLRNEHVTCKETLEKEQLIAQPDNNLMTQESNDTRRG